MLAHRGFQEERTASLMNPVNITTEGPDPRPRHVTVRDGKAGLPYSKGLMATSVMASGLPPYRAFHVAEVIENLLHEQGVEDVSSDDLRELAVRVLEEEIGARYAANYRRWQAAQHRRVPLVVLLGGSTGVGKSTVATMLANRLGIVRIASTDAVREVMRGMFTREMLPAVHASSFDVARLLPEARGADAVLDGFRQQVQAVSVGATQLIRRAVMEGTDLIVEGAHVVPGFLSLPPAEEALVAQVVITVDDEDIHRSHFAARAQDSRARGHDRYLEHFEDIRKIQEYVRGLAVAHGVPVVPSYGLDATVARVTEIVVEAATNGAQRPTNGPGAE